MPELPDVEGFRQVAEKATGQRFSHVEVIDASVLRNTTAQTLTRSVVGQRLGRPSRRGKWLIVPADHASVLIHFGMTGLLDWQHGDRDPHPHDRVIFETDGGRLVYRDQRKLQGLWLARDADQVESVIGEQGPDALGLSWRAFQAAMAARKGALKAVLMDQAVISGLGNILTDEILWRAGVHPSRSWDELDPGV